MNEEEVLSCIRCKSTNDLTDLFADNDRDKTCAKKLLTYYDIEVSSDLKHYVCAVCVENFEKAVAIGKQVCSAETIADIEDIIKDEEELDEALLEEADDIDSFCEPKLENDDDFKCEYIDDEHAVQSIDDTLCIYCGLELPTAELIASHIQSVHEIEPRTGMKLQQCPLCGVPMPRLAEHIDRCHNTKYEIRRRNFECYFCDKVYSDKKACFTHLRMKHRLKLCFDQPVKVNKRQRRKCHLCNKDFSQKQVLNKHLWKAHRIEAERRKAFICPLCNERVSYGSHFSAHLLHAHKVFEQIEELEFFSMDDFILFKSAIQEETKARFRKTTASKQTIEGVRSHYMCSQSGVYVYQGKGKRMAPERQIYKTGKACPAHMIVTETPDRVLVTFYKTHVGHGPCPYFEPREYKKPKDEPTDDDPETLICDICGMGFLNETKFKEHTEAHQHHSLPCHFCPEYFQTMDDWTHHLRNKHSLT